VRDQSERRAQQLEGGRYPFGVPSGEEVEEQAAQDGQHQCRGGRAVCPILPNAGQARGQVWAPCTGPQEGRGPRYGRSLVSRWASSAREVTPSLG
jgi:hypothetical protein